MFSKTELKNLTEEKLNELGIFQLRTIARNIGVHLPTTMKKQDLVTQILKVAKGEVAPFVPKNKKGRPAKSLMDIQSSWSSQGSDTKSINLVNNSWELGKYIEPDLSFDANFGVSMPTFTYNEDTDDGQIVEGIAFCEANGAVTLHIGGITKLNENNITVIKPQIAITSMIRTGDEIKCLLNPRTNSVFKILYINEKSEHQIKVFDKLQPILPNQIINLWGNKSLGVTKFICPVGKGQRVLLRGEKGSGKSELLKNIALQLDKSEIKTIYVALDKRPEDKINFSNTNIDYVFSSFDTIPFRQMYMLNLAIEKSKRMCENGLDVAIIIDDLFSAGKAYDYCLQRMGKDELLGLDISAIIALKKILAVGRNTDTGGSITLIGSLTVNNQFEDSRLLSMIDEICNCHIITDKNLYQGGFETWISLDSWTDNDRKLLSPSDLNIANKIKEECKNKTNIEIEKVCKKYFE